LLLLIACLLFEVTVTSSTPAARDTVILIESEENVRKEDQTRGVNSRGNICENRGRFCEIICKNNPSEGGKMCK